MERLQEMGERAEEMLARRARLLREPRPAGAESLVELDELIDRSNRRFVERLSSSPPTRRCASGCCGWCSSRGRSSGSEIMRWTLASRPPTSSRPSSASSRTRRILSRTRRSALARGGLVALLVAGCGGGGGGRRRETRPLSAPGARSWRRSSRSGPTDYQQRAGVTVTYGAIGSGGGIAQITARTVDFGASDAPLTPDQASAARAASRCRGRWRRPLVAYNVNGVIERAEALRARARGHLPRQGHASGTTPRSRASTRACSCRTTRSCPSIEATAAATRMRSATILAKVSPEWKEQGGRLDPGELSGRASAPRATTALRRSSRRTDGAIGYLAISYVVASELDFALVQNAAGKFPVPGIPSILAAAKTATTIPAGQRDLDHQPAGVGARRVPDLDLHVRDRPEGARRKASTLRPFLTYAVTVGQKFAPPLSFRAAAAGRSWPRPKEAIGTIH